MQSEDNIANWPCRETCVSSCRASAPACRIEDLIGRGNQEYSPYNSLTIEFFKLLSPNLPRTPVGVSSYRASAPACPIEDLIGRGNQECLPYNSNPIRYGQSDQCETNPARTGFSLMYSHFSSADSSCRSKRSKQPGCHCQSALRCFRIARFIAADSDPTVALRSRGPANR